MIRGIRKHLLPAILAVLLCLLPALAGAEGMLRTAWDAGTDLLFDTHNVSCHGTATFQLDGKLFKTAQMDYVQVGYVSYQKLALLTPRADGTERHTGYTIYDENGDVYVMEAYNPGYYRNFHANPSNTVMRNTVYLKQLMTLGASAVSALDELLTDKIKVTELEAGCTSTELSLKGKDLPEWVGSSVNLFWDYFLRRFYFLNSDMFSLTGFADVGDYATVFEGLQYTTAHVSIEKMDLKLAMDGVGRLNEVSGSATLIFMTQAGASHKVDIGCTLTASNYGTSTIKAFRPEDYDVVPIVWEE